MTDRSTDRFAQYPLDKAHRLFEPGPVVLVSTADGQRVNLMTNGFNMPVRHSATLALVVGPWDHSFTALRDTGECVIGIPGRELLETVVDIGNVSGADVDKWERYGLTPAPAATVRAPLVAECFANVECTVADDRLVDDYSLWLLRIERAWIDPAAPAGAEVHHRGDGTFSANGELIDLRARMTKWEALTRD
ncbi:flavin reductase family protein [Promicromonospora iranensis]|uniref:Flavin reductase (DIM6/NTAB) family NADH-FMN oxidoreductase RutF n=1 Tax=Promicromonospora iranensis TaxID=1105144 RepID=A0ABU2CGQ7_9MICO|nr:flavin reductase family protein [Promicromonospora iranensis]MDR7380519.1 flavin reductase (DIM6/NTAB) family NADH-FMN oxidoreductase RutF [Promicromonospora iranensis]